MAQFKQGETQKYLMNPGTGSVDTEEQWRKEEKEWGEEEFGFENLIEVVLDRGEWVEV